MWLQGANVIGESTGRKASERPWTTNCSFVCYVFVCSPTSLGWCGAITDVIIGRFMAGNPLIILEPASAQKHHGPMHVTFARQSVCECVT